MNLLTIENELKKIHTMPPWGRKQNNDWDALSNFVYQCPSYEAFMTAIDKPYFEKGFVEYATHRWFNTWSAMGVEHIFCSQPTVIPHKNKKDKLVDFQIQGINFDHKTTIFPKNIGYDIDTALKNPHHLLRWLYENQSTEGRFHTSNRLFVVLHKKNGQHWQLRAQLTWLQPIIESYLANFHMSRLHSFYFQPTILTYTDIIWAIEED